jgi:hypothetical protein
MAGHAAPASRDEGVCGAFRLATELSARSREPSGRSGGGPQAAALIASAGSSVGPVGRRSISAAGTSIASAAG